MSYRENEREKVIALRDEIFRDPGDGLFMKSKREFVLSQPALNLWAGIREDAIKYFVDNKITWWHSKNEPTGHLLSSQIACVNHLYFLRQREDAASEILKKINPDIRRACKLDNGYVEFEVTGGNPLKERGSGTRGVNSTSIDAVMLGEKSDGSRILFCIEWKYTESYDPKSLGDGNSGATRIKTYEKFLKESDCPIICNDINYLLYEPYYQLMRQTLLAWQMVKNHEYGATDWLNIHIIPENNLELRNTNTSPFLTGNNLSLAWKSVLKQPDKYVVITPEDFIEPARNLPDTSLIIKYLERRYWR